MITLDEEALICDLAETYHIYNYRELRPSLVGVLACGLREDSRIALKQAGLNVSPENMMLAMIIDKLEIQSHQLARLSGIKHLPKPVSLVDALRNKKKKDSNITFDSGEGFDKEWMKLTGG